MNLESFAWPAVALVAVICLFLLARESPQPFAKFFQFLQGALSEDNKKPSSSRINLFQAVTQWAAAITYGFIYVVRNNPNFILGYLATMALLIGGLFGIKQYGKTTEQKVAPDVNAPPEVKP